ncbi:hypothetical protein HDU97_000284 [Phlyctochytrium planicorne]|nr:hypothetical protein HDU97_000284 [Phlyctochytrium planicorne]
MTHRKPSHPFPSPPLATPTEQMAEDPVTYSGQLMHSHPFPTPDIHTNHMSTSPFVPHTNHSSAPVFNMEQMMAAAKAAAKVAEDMREMIQWQLAQQQQQMAASLKSDSHHQIPTTNNNNHHHNQINEPSVYSPSASSASMMHPLPASPTVLTGPLSSQQDAQPPAKVVMPNTKADTQLQSEATSTSVSIAVYNGISVYEISCGGVVVMKRKSDSYLNATQILKAAGIAKKEKRTEILDLEMLHGSVEKVQGGHGKYQGLWVSFERGVNLARRFNIFEAIRPLLEAGGPGENGMISVSPTFSKGQPLPTSEFAFASLHGNQQTMMEYLAGMDNVSMSQAPASSLAPALAMGHHGIPNAHLGLNSGISTSSSLMPLAKGIISEGTHAAMMEEQLFVDWMAEDVMVDHSLEGVESGNVMLPAASPFVVGHLPTHQQPIPVTNAGLTHNTPASQGISLHSMKPQGISLVGPIQTNPITTTSPQGPLPAQEISPIYSSVSTNLHNPTSIPFQTKLLGSKLEPVSPPPSHPSALLQVTSFGPFRDPDATSPISTTLNAPVPMISPPPLPSVVTPAEASAEPEKKKRGRPAGKRDAAAVAAKSKKAMMAANAVAAAAAAVRKAAMEARAAKGGSLNDQKKSAVLSNVRDENHDSAPTTPASLLPRPTSILPPPPAPNSILPPPSSAQPQSTFDSKIPIQPNPSTSSSVAIHPLQQIYGDPTIVNRALEMTRAAAAGGVGNGRNVRQQRKSAHNAIERRYRNNINQRIADLKSVVPALNSTRIGKAVGKSASNANNGDDDEDSDDGDDQDEILDGIPAARKLNKATILRKATEYIVHLKTELGRCREETDAFRRMLRGLGVCGEDGGVRQEMSPPRSGMSSPGSPEGRKRRREDGEDVGLEKDEVEGWRKVSRIEEKDGGGLVAVGNGGVLVGAVGGVRMMMMAFMTAGAFYVPSPFGEVVSAGNVFGDGGAEAVVSPVARVGEWGAGVDMQGKIGTASLTVGWALTIVWILLKSVVVAFGLFSVLSFVISSRRRSQIKDSFSSGLDDAEARFADLTGGTVGRKKGALTRAWGLVWHGTGFVVTEVLGLGGLVDGVAGGNGMYWRDVAVAGLKVLDKSACVGDSKQKESLDLLHLLTIAFQISTAATLAGKHLPASRRCRLHLSVAVTIRMVSASLISRRNGGGDRFDLHWIPAWMGWRLPRVWMGMRMVADFVWGLGVKDACEGGDGVLEEDARAIEWVRGLEEGRKGAVLEWVDLVEGGSGETFGRGFGGKTLVDNVWGGFRWAGIAKEVLGQVGQGGLLAFPVRRGPVGGSKRGSVDSTCPLLMRFAADAAACGDATGCWGSAVGAVMAAWSGGDGHVDDVMRLWMEVERSRMVVGEGAWARIENRSRETASLALFAAYRVRCDDRKTAVRAAKELGSVIKERLADRDVEVAVKNAMEGRVAGLQRALSDRTKMLAALEFAALSWCLSAALSPLPFGGFVAPPRVGVMAKTGTEGSAASAEHLDEEMMTIARNVVTHMRRLLPLLQVAEKRGRRQGVAGGAIENVMAWTNVIL